MQREVGDMGVVVSIVVTVVVLAVLGALIVAFWKALDTMF